MSWRPGLGSVNAIAPKARELDMSSITSAAFQLLPFCAAQSAVLHGVKKNPLRLRQAKTALNQIDREREGVEGQDRAEQN
jgi:hypothetical protein